jgi:precorrin-2 dehydrogenase/sirohydrochlorin ferrochelatase
VGGLVAAGAKVTVVAPLIADELRAIPNLRIVRRRYEQGDLRSQWLVVTCTDDPAVNARVFADAEDAGIWSNSVDDPVNCAFTLPAVARRGDLAIAISTSGKSPALASWLRKRFERELDESYDALLDLLVDVRAEVRATVGTSEIAGWAEALDDGIFDLVAAGDVAAARSRLRTHLGLEVAA